MNKELEKDTRGFDLRVENFRTQLIQSLNNSNLPISIILYILKELCNEASLEYDRIVNQQYKEFCEEAKKELQTEEENSSSSND